jgi:biotin-(acetyl-CoA carboxylase) ligase
MLEDELVTGATDGLEPSGALRIRKDDGSIAIVHSGDVQRLREQSD